MTAQYYNNVDQVILVPSDDEDKIGHREHPPLYTTLPRSGEKKHNMKDSTEPTSLMRTARQERSEKKRLKRIFRAVSINNYEIISIMTS